VLKKALPLGGGKKAYEKRLLPLPGRKIGREGSGSPPKVKDTRRVACVSCRKILCLPPRNAHGRRAVEARCGGQAEDIITATGAVNADETGRSRPIGATCGPA
jgi:hypothetical protein